MNIAIMGLGYVGMTAAACLASRGHRVIGVDPSETKVSAVTAGRSPINEPGLQGLVAESVAAGRLTAMPFLTAEVASCDLVIVCVGTPSAVDGSHDMTHIVEVTRQLAELMRQNPDGRLTVAYRSTFRPGTIEELILPLLNDVMGELAERIEVVYNPEFLRESTSIADFFSPPKIVVGTRTGEPCATLGAINEGIDAPTFNVRYRESEITKFVDNTFHAVKTAFANEIGRLCVKLGISAAEVHKIFVSDTKLNISPYYLRPGGAFGGSCLPKDVRALSHMARLCGGSTYVVDALIASNEAHKAFLFELVARDVPHGGRVLMLGLAFKDRSDDLRESPNIDLARMLITAGYQLAIFDPFVEPAKLMGQNLGALSNSPFVRELLVDQQLIESQKWDAVVDTRSIAGEYALSATTVVDVNRLA